MSQHDFEILNSDANTGVTIRSQMDDALQALANTSLSGLAPTTTYPSQFWADTTSNALKIRSSDNSSWVVVGTLDETYLGLLSASLANKFTSNQKLKGDGILWRFRDTVTGNEWGIKSDNGVLEFCENTNSETDPVWTKRNSVGINGIEYVATATDATNANTVDTYVPSVASSSGVIPVSGSDNISPNFIPSGLDAQKVDGVDVEFGEITFSVADNTLSTYVGTAPPWSYQRYWASAYGVSWTSAPTSGRFSIVNTHGVSFTIGNSTGSTISGKIRYMTMGKIL